MMDNTAFSLVVQALYALEQKGELPPTFTERHPWEGNLVAGMTHPDPRLRTPALAALHAIACRAPDPATAP